MSIDLKVNEERAFSLIQNAVRVKVSLDLHEYFNAFCTDLSYLVDFVKTFRDSKNQLRVVLIDRLEQSQKYINDQVEDCFVIMKDKDNYDSIPYIEYSFKETQYWGGANFEHVFMLFFTEHNKFDDGERAILNTLYKFETKLKIML
jgi:hypothetical protein